MPLPRILLIDDLCYWHPRQRQRMIKRFGLRDVSGDDNQAPNAVGNPLAEVVVRTAQEVAADRVVNSVPVGLAAVAEDPEGWAMVLLDLQFISGPKGPDGKPTGPPQPGDDEFGEQLLDRILKVHPHLPVLVLSAQPESEFRRRVEQAGAVEFLSRHMTEGNQSPDKERTVLKERLHRFGLIDDLEGKILGSSLALRQALKEARAAAYRVPKSGKRDTHGNMRPFVTLLQGPTGTGKSLFVEYILRHSHRQHARYEEVQLTGNEDLDRDTLFGHKRGAFSGATGARGGVLNKANGGTVFLDELHTIKPQCLTALLGVLEHGRVRPHGSDNEKQLDLHVILGTNLADDELADQLKLDLRARISRFVVRLPALSERPSDLAVLVRGLVDREAKRQGEQPPIVSDGFIEAVRKRAWPANVRGLTGKIEHILALYKGTLEVHAWHLNRASVPASSNREGAGIPPQVAGEPRAPTEATEIPSCQYPKPISPGFLREVERTHMRMLARHLVAAWRQTHPERERLDLARLARFLAGAGKVRSDVGKRMIKSLFQRSGPLRDLIDELLQEDAEFANFYNEVMARSG